MIKINCEFCWICASIYKYLRSSTSFCPIAHKCPPYLRLLSCRDTSFPNDVKVQVLLDCVVLTEGAMQGEGVDTIQKLHQKEAEQSDGCWPVWIRTFSRCFSRRLKSESVARVAIVVRRLCLAQCFHLVCVMLFPCLLSRL